MDKVATIKPKIHFPASPGVEAHEAIDRGTVARQLTSERPSIVIDKQIDQVYEALLTQRAEPERVNWRIAWAHEALNGVNSLTLLRNSLRGARVYGVDLAKLYQCQALVAAYGCVNSCLGFRHRRIDSDGDYSVHTASQNGQKTEEERREPTDDTTKCFRQLARTGKNAVTKIDTLMQGSSEDEQFTDPLLQIDVRLARVVFEITALFHSWKMEGNWTRVSAERKERMLSAEAECNELSRMMHRHPYFQHYKLRKTALWLLEKIPRTIKRK